SVPEEPFALPFADLATRVLILPLAFEENGWKKPLLASWEDVSHIAGEVYDEARAKDRGVSETARRIAGAGGSGNRAKAQALYTFVRDEIATDEDDEAIWVPNGSTVAQTLSRKHGDSAEKALLLQALLHEVKLIGLTTFVLIAPCRRPPAWRDQHESGQSNLVRPGAGGGRPRRQAHAPRSGGPRSRIRLPLAVVRGDSGADPRCEEAGDHHPARGACGRERAAGGARSRTGRRRAPGRHRNAGAHR